MDVERLLTREPFPVVRTASLGLVAENPNLRCDAKQAEERYKRFDELIARTDNFELGDFLPGLFVKGRQPNYLEDQTASGIPVINTLSIQDMRLHPEACRVIPEEDFEAEDDERKPTRGDVLLTMDGGPSIGKPLPFDHPEEYAIDSHIAILRPVGLDPVLLAILLASPLGQLQFLRAESGASGQTAVTEDDVRRFRFPIVDDEAEARIKEAFRRGRATLEELEQQIEDTEKGMWGDIAGMLGGEAS